MLLWWYNCTYGTYQYIIINVILSNRIATKAACTATVVNMIILQFSYSTMWECQHHLGNMLPTWLCQLNNPPIFSRSCWLHYQSIRRRGSKRSTPIACVPVNLAIFFKNSAISPSGMVWQQTRTAAAAASTSITGNSPMIMTDTASTHKLKANETPSQNNEKVKRKSWDITRSSFVWRFCCLKRSSSTWTFSMTNKS